jgi:hypothetical protein
MSQENNHQKICIFCHYGPDEYFGNEFIEIKNKSGDIHYAHPWCVLKGARTLNEYNDAFYLIDRGIYSMTYGNVDNIKF